MLIVNLISIVTGIVLFALCAYVFENISALLASVVFVIMLNSILSEICVLKIIKVKIIKDFIIETIMTVSFILCASLLSLWVGCAVYCGVFVLYGAISYKSIVAIFKKIFKKKLKAVPADGGPTEATAEQFTVEETEEGTVSENVLNSEETVPEDKENMQ